jgi:predicted transcriptional regulator
LLSDATGFDRRPIKNLDVKNLDDYDVTVTAKETALTVRFSEAQGAKLARLAEIEDRSKSAVIRRAVDRLGSPPAEPENWELSGWDYGEGDR